MAEIVVVGSCSEVLSTLHLVHVGDLSKAVKSTKRIIVLPAPSVCSHSDTVIIDGTMTDTIGLHLTHQKVILKYTIQ